MINIRKQNFKQIIDYCLSRCLTIVILCGIFTKHTYAQCDKDDFLIPDYSIVRKHVNEYLRTTTVVRAGDCLQLPHEKLRVELSIDPDQTDYDFIISTLKGFGESSSEDPYVLCMLRQCAFILYPIWEDVYLPMTVSIFPPKNCEWDHMSQYDERNPWLWTNTWHENESLPTLFARKIRCKSL